MKRLIIDTDPGVDDVLTILMLLRDTNFQIELIASVFGNVSIEKTTQNAAYLLDLCDRNDIKLEQGAREPLEIAALFAPEIHGDDGLTGFQKTRQTRVADLPDAVEAMREVLAAAHEPVTILALGPLTNIANLLKADPACGEKIERIVLQGGASLTWGNSTPAASFNHFSDPHAADIVYRSGLPITQIGLDVCRGSGINGAKAREVFGSSETEIGRFIWHLLKNHWSVDPSTGLTAATSLEINDALCAAYLLAPEIFKTEHLTVKIEVQGEYTAGATVTDFDNVWGEPPNIDVALTVDSDAYESL